MRDRHFPENKGKSTSCPLCHEENETIAHLHQGPAARLARTLIAQKTLDRKSILILSTATHEDFTLRSPNIDPKDLLTLITFSLALWTARNKYIHAPLEDNTISNDAQSQRYAHFGNRSRRCRCGQPAWAAPRACEGKPVWLPCGLFFSGLFSSGLSDEV